jgi:hypothetical protein
MRRECDQSSKNAGPCEGSIPARPKAIQKKIRQESRDEQGPGGSLRNAAFNGETSGEVCGVHLAGPGFAEDIDEREDGDRNENQEQLNDRVVDTHELAPGC